MSAAWCGRRDWSSSCARSRTGKPYDQAAYEACLTESIAEVVRQQAEAGVDIVSDGEFGKGRNWAFYVHDRLTGIAARPLTPEEAKDPLASAGGGQDREAFPEFYAEYDSATGLGARLGKRFVVTGPIRYTGHAAGAARHRQPQGGAPPRPRSPGAFLPVVAPASALPGAKNEHYTDEKSFLFALADALHEEYQAIVDAGLYVQIDDAFLPYMHEKLVPPMTLGAVPGMGAAAHRRAQSRARRHSARRSRAITSAGAAGTGRTPSTCR